MANRGLPSAHEYHSQFSAAPSPSSSQSAAMAPSFASSSAAAAFCSAGPIISAEHKNSMWSPGLFELPKSASSPAAPNPARQTAPSGQDSANAAQFLLSAGEFVEINPTSQRNWTGPPPPAKSAKSAIPESPASVAAASLITNLEEVTGQNLYKTELCRSFEETGACRYGAKCQFAHGLAELRHLVRHPKYKTEVCKTFHTIGTCPYGKRCRFIHIAAADAPYAESFQQAQHQQQAQAQTTPSPQQTPQMQQKQQQIQPQYQQHHRRNSSTSSRHNNAAALPFIPAPHAFQQHPDNNADQQQQQQNSNPMMPRIDAPAGDWSTSWKSQSQAFLFSSGGGGGQSQPMQHFQGGGFVKPSFSPPSPLPPSLEEPFAPLSDSDSSSSKRDVERRLSIFQNITKQN